MQLLFEDVHGHIAFLYHRSLLLWLRQGTLVHLLVLIQGDGLNLHRHGRHHVRRLLIHDEVVQSLYVYLLIADDVGSDELTSAASFLIEGLHGSVLDAREFADDCLHLFQLDAEATDLHLSVATAYELNVARGQIAYDVARAIDSRVLLIICKGIADIHFCRFLRTVQVATAHLRATDP